jgi:hypothetical protein
MNKIKRGNQNFVDNNLGDWRIHVITTLLKPYKHFKTGSKVAKITATRNYEEQIVSFISPNPIALSIDSAINASGRAGKLYKKIKFKKEMTNWGESFAVKDDSIPILYDYFEECMVVISFCYQSIEAFCNLIISKNLTGKYKLKRKTSTVKYSAGEIQRKVSTEEKLSTVVPNLLKIKNLKQEKFWKEFKELKRIRDSTIHLKARLSLGEGLDNESLFYYFFHTDVSKYPKLVLEIIEYCTVEEDAYRWQKYLRNYIDNIPEWKEKIKNIFPDDDSYYIS